MNLLANKTHYFLLLILFFLISCKSKKNLGKDFVPANEQLKVLIDSSYLEMSTLRVDSIPSYLYTTKVYKSDGELASNYFNFLIGETQFNNLVSNKITTYTRLNYHDVATIDQNATLDSLVFKIKGSGITEVNGDSTKPFTFKLFRTLSAIDTSGLLGKYPFEKMDLDPTPLVTVTFQPTQLLKNNDTLEFILDNSFAEKILTELKNTSNSVEDFHNAVKSLAFVGEGGNLVAFSTTSFELILHYSTNTAKASVDLSPYNGTYTSWYYLGIENKFNNELALIKNRETINSTLTNGQIFLQRYSSLSARVKIPQLSHLIDIKDKIIVNRAELLMKGSNKSSLLPDLKFYHADSIITVGYSNSSNYLSYINNFVANKYISTNIVGSNFRKSENVFAFDVTDYVQQLLHGNITNRELVLYNNNIGLLTLGDGTMDPRNYVLKVYYSKLN